MNTVQIYVREVSWDMYIVSYDDQGNKIAVSANKDTMDTVIYNIGWEETAKSMAEDGYNVTVHYFES